MKDSDDLELQITADEMCRTCLVQFSPDQLKPIFCSEIVDGKIIAFPKILQMTVGIKPVKNDSFPKNVCLSCKTKLKELFSFKEKISNSEDLLYDIFRMEKPVLVPELPPALPKPSTVTSGMQTDPIQISEADESSYADFLTIEKAKKLAMQDFSCQAMPRTEEGFCQTDPALKSLVDAAIQTISPVLLQQESESPTDMLVSNLQHEGHFLDLDVIEESDDDQDIESLEEQAFESVMGDDVEHIGFFVEMTNAVSKSAGVKLEEIDDEHFVEYMNIEALEDSTTASHTVTKSVSKSIKTSKNIVHRCNYCDYTTEDKRRFTSHISVHQQTLEGIFEKIDYFRCTDCNSVYGTSGALDKHFRNGPCKKVDLTMFTQSTDVVKHEQFYNGNGLDVCLPRLKSFHKTKKASILCGRCDLPFKTLNEGVIHFVSTHESDLETQLEVEQMWEENGYNQIHACGICNEQFPDASFIRQHVYFHRSVYECPYGCKKKFDSFLQLTEHVEHTHLKDIPSNLAANKLVPKNASPDLVCNICFKLFSSVASMKIHKKNHFVDRRYTCHMCSKAFIQKSDLTIHIRSHTNERPFFCTFQGCDKRFRTSSHRRDHMSTHAEENRFQCEHCNKYFKASRILQGHMRLHTGSRPFECEICTKSFSRKQHLKLHMKTHEKE